MRCFVTGVAGFIGSHLAERLIEQGHEVTGLDRFTDYYPRAVKEGNLARLRQSSAFRLIEEDLAAAHLDPLLEGAEIVFHQAAQPGVRASWGQTFEAYTRDNILATQRLLEAVKGRASVRRFVYASSSSVYGDTDDLPMRETSLPKPYSPYGVTKLAAEHLCELYRHNFGVPTVSLRYFTVYGPRQRPDMGFHKFIRATLEGRAIPVFGDGEQTRDFTFISDAVDANIASMEANPGVYNIGGGSRVTLKQVLATLGEVIGYNPILNFIEPQAGDVRHTWADTSAAREALGFSPKVPLREGLAAQVAWHKEQMGQASA
ncbi:MAG: NAD-dependent epimerase/dehydratase family protein [Polyangiaceae bacterium]|nr:NAD-dependent epimerase/dehydratase family protein [Polyangiaceae bacterium]